MYLTHTDRSIDLVTVYSSGTVVASCCTDRIIEYIKYQIVFANVTIHIQPICTSPCHRDTSENNSSFNFSDFSSTSL